MNWSRFIHAEIWLLNHSEVFVKKRILLILKSNPDILQRHDASFIHVCYDPYDRIRLN